MGKFKVLQRKVDVLWAAHNTEIKHGVMLDDMSVVQVTERQLIRGFAEAIDARNKRWPYPFMAYVYKHAIEGTDEYSNHWISFWNALIFCVDTDKKDGR